MRRVILLCFLIGCTFDPDPFELDEPMPEEGASSFAEAPPPTMPHDPRAAAETDPTGDPPGVGIPCDDSSDYETDGDDGHGHGNGGGGGEDESWDPCRLYGLECRDGTCEIP